MFENTFKNIDDILHKDAGCSSELDYVEQTSWVLFLKYLDDLESCIVKDLIKMIISSICFEIGLQKNKIILKHFLYQVLLEGQELGYHNDASSFSLDYSGYSALLYLNDNYEGGEILFYNKKYDDDSYIKIKPNSGDCIFFPGDSDHPHSVNKVKKGERSSLIIFFDIVGKQ